MKNALLIGLVTAFFLIVPSLAGVAGSWDVVSNSSYGESYQLTMSIVESNGQLSGTMATPMGDTPMEKIKLEAEKLSFELWIAGSKYTAVMTVKGDEMTGTWRSDTDSGTAKASRKK